jgi:hypothetical protein
MSTTAKYIRPAKSTIVLIRNPVERLAHPSLISTAHQINITCISELSGSEATYLAARWMGVNRVYVQVSRYKIVDRMHNRMDVTVRVHDTSIQVQKLDLEAAIAMQMPPERVPEKKL